MGHGSIPAVLALEVEARAAGDHRGDAGAYPQAVRRESPVGRGVRSPATDMLGYDPPCTDAILKYMVGPRRLRKPSMTRPLFLRKHLDVS